MRLIHQKQLTKDASRSRVRIVAAAAIALDERQRLLFVRVEEKASVDIILLRRVEAKKARDFVAADALREEALQLGLLLNDRQRTFESVDGGFLPSGDLPQGLDVAAVDPRRRTRRLDGDTAHSTLGRLRRQASGRGASAYSGGAPLVAPAESQTHKGDN